MDEGGEQQGSAVTADAEDAAATVGDQPPLAREDIDAFVKEGFVLLKGAFSREAAQAARRELWTRLEQDGIVPHDDGTWPLRHGIAQCYGPEDGDIWREVLTPRLQCAIDQLCGVGRSKTFGCGWWVVTFPGVSQPPWEVNGHWHVDGHGYRHFPYSAEIGLIPIFIFNDIGPEDGGTVLSRGSHIEVAKLLWREGDAGMEGGFLSRRARQGLSEGSVVEVNGEAGDVMLIHPFMVHARSKNLGQRGLDSVRFMCHPAVPLSAPMNVGAVGDAGVDDSLRSPVEKAIVDARRVIEEEKKDEQAESEIFSALGFSSFGGSGSTNKKRKR